MPIGKIQIKLSYDAKQLAEVAHTGRQLVIQLSTSVRVFELRMAPPSLSDLDGMMRCAMEDGDFVELAALATFAAELDAEV